jgi:hypothetical protein
VKKQREVLKMETNERAKREQYQAAENELLKLIEAVEEIEKGDLKELEEKIYEGIFKIGGRLMEGVLSKGREPVQTKVEGKCSHNLTLVGYRTKKMLTLFGVIEWKRPYYQCQVEEEKEEGDEKESEKLCSHGRCPDDEIWGVDGTRTTPGVQRHIGYLCATLTFEEAAETFRRFLPLGMSARQALNLMKPVGKALETREDEVVKALFDKALQAESQEEGEVQKVEKDIRRLYIELDGIFARMRRGSVPMEEHEVKRIGDIYREVKVGATFLAERGRERSELVEGVYIDIPKDGTMRYVARRTAKGGFGPLLYALAEATGLSRAQQVVVLGDGAVWIWKLVAEHFVFCGPNRRSLSGFRTCLGGCPCSLWKEGAKC